MNLKVMVKRILVNIILVACISCFAQQGLNVYDAEGHLLTKMASLSELNLKNCPSKRCFVAQNAERKANVGAFIKKGHVKSKGRKRWYEVGLNEGIKLCPETKFSEGNWIVNGSAFVDPKNCVLIEGSPYARSILVLFVKNQNDLSDADTNWILVNQTIVEMSGSLSKVWIPQRDYVGAPMYKEKWKTEILKQDLIVDKTEFTIREAFELNREVCRQECGENYTDKKKYFCKEVCSEKIDVSFYSTDDSSALLNYPVKLSERADMIRYATWRSKRDQLDAVFPKVPFDSSVAGILLSIRPDKKEKMVMDTSKNGYRIPYNSEWTFLQSGGRQSDFFWGDDTLLARQYEWDLSDSRDGGVRAVAKLDANPFGLYDVYGNANEKVFEEKDGKVFFPIECNGFSVNYTMSSTCWFQNKIQASQKVHGRQICVGGDCHGYVYRGMNGIRFVRKLE
ncbi:MAG: SUMF1/EgtB/PvdO family nonheme iron enzyme [Fibrobacter sp.]|nr:SUMF1/EgtB/PvdO family nonheme iron enzyme [Fibrobacter sp.]